MIPTTLLLLLFTVTERPVVPATLDVTQPTCLAIGAPDADVLYLVPRSICDSRVCRLRLELQAVRAEGRPPEPVVLGEGELTAGVALWNDTVRAQVEAAAGRFAFPCRATPVSGSLLAGTRRYTLAERHGSWWARSDNGREQPLSRIGDGDAAPVVVDGHPGFRAWAFARASDLDGTLHLMRIPLERLAAPPFAELVAAPGGATDDRMCLGWDRDLPAMLVTSRRHACAGGADCQADVRLLRVSARGTEELGRLGSDAARARLADLDLGCSEDALDEPTFGDVTLMIGPSLNEGAIDLGVFVPRERHWNLGALRTVDTRDGKQREMVTGVAWHPDVPFLVLRVVTPSGEGERFVWVDLAAKGVVARARR